MAIKEIVKYPSPILEQKCTEVVKFDEKLAKLLDDMHETMIEVDGIGLAAPQVGETIQVAIVDLGKDKMLLNSLTPSLLQ